MYAKVISWPRKRELLPFFQERFNQVVAASGEIEELRLFERGDFIDFILLISDRPGSGQEVVVSSPDDLYEIVDDMNSQMSKKETTAKLIGLLPLSGGRYVGTVIARPAVEEVKRDANKGQDAKSHGSSKRRKQPSAIA